MFFISQIWFNNRLHSFNSLVVTGELLSASLISNFNCIFKPYLCLGWLKVLDLNPWMRPKVFISDKSPFMTPLSSAYLIRFITSIILIVTKFYFNWDECWFTMAFHSTAAAVRLFQRNEVWFGEMLFCWFAYLLETFFCWWLYISGITQKHT